jgi:hypothetical protein
MLRDLAILETTQRVLEGSCFGILPF